METNLVFDLDKIGVELKNLDKATQSTEHHRDLFADIKMTQLNENYQDCCQSEASHLLVSNVRKLNEFVANTLGNDANLLISKETFQKSINVVDIVTVNSTRTNCFTKK